MVKIIHFCAYAGLAMSNIAAAEPIVQIEKSKVSYRGVAKGSVEDFYNIKFAHDTSGSFRFSPPQPFTPPDGSEVDATAPGPACPQLRAAVAPFFDETPDQSEDCLNLRITRPAGTSASDNLPVVIHVVGGGVIKSSANDEHFDPVNLITQSVLLERPIIHVIFNYRVTIFGFARLPILKNQKSLNVGMRDQRAAFQWVKDNIAAFGGDPDRITSFGLSSGGTFSSLHLMTYGGDKGVPFTQAWAMSGPPGTALNITSEVTELHTRNVAEQLGCVQHENDEELLECLRKVPMDQLTEAAMAYSVNNHPPAGLFTFIPSIDGDFLPERQSALYRAGKFVKGIPIVFGWTHDDGATNAGPPPSFQTEEDMKTPIKNFAHALVDDDYERLFALYPASEFEQAAQNYAATKTDAYPEAPVHYFRIARIMRDLLFTCSSIDFGFEVSRQSKAENPAFSGVRLYDLNQSMVSPLFHAAGMPYLGAIHGSDMDYLYNNMFAREQLSEQDRQLSDTLIASFISFAYTSDPTIDKSQPWPEAFPDHQVQGSHHAESGGPSSINLQVLGGPLGTGSSLLESSADGSASMSASEGSMQNPAIDTTQFGEMGSAIAEQRQQELRREVLLKRCAFINSLAEKLGH